MEIDKKAYFVLAVCFLFMCWLNTQQRSAIEIGEGRSWVEFDDNGKPKFVDKK